MNDIPITQDNIRRLLISSAIAVLDGRLSPKEANAIAGLVAEVHKNIKLEYVAKLIDNKSPTIYQELEAIKYVK